MPHKADGFTYTLATTDDIEGVVSAKADLSALDGKADVSAVEELDDALSLKADAATTLSGYGIEDAKIENGVITLGD